MSQFAFLVTMAPDDGAIVLEASAIIRQTLQDGHRAVVFLYEEGVYFASNQRDVPQGDLDPAKGLTELATHDQCTVIACITASERRGLTEASLADGIQFGGLGEWTEAVVHADSVVQFR